MYSNNFDAEMSEDEMENGELFHLEIERYRRIVMQAGITKSSDELSKVIREDSNAYTDVLKLGVSTIEHYSNILELLIGGIERLYIVAEKFDLQNSSKKSKETMEAVATIISRKMDSQ